MKAINIPQINILFKIEKSKDRKDVPIIVGNNTPNSNSRSSYLLLVNRLKKMEKNPSLGFGKVERKALKDSYTDSRGMITCQYCGKDHPAEEITLDHVRPQMFGGKDSYSNIRLVCSKCNGMKGAIFSRYTPTTFFVFSAMLATKTHTSALNILNYVLENCTMDEKEIETLEKIKRAELRWREVEAKKGKIIKESSVCVKSTLEENKIIVNRIHRYDYEPVKMAV